MDEKVFGITGLLGLALVSGIVVAEPATEALVEDAGNTDVAKAVVSNRMVFIDPDSGEMTSQPNAEAMSEMLESKAREKSGVASPAKVMEDGSLMIEFNGQFTNSIHATINENGEIETRHREGLKVEKVAE